MGSIVSKFFLDFWIFFIFTRPLREHLHKKWLHYLIKGKLELVRLSLINIHV